MLLLSTKGEKLFSPPSFHGYIEGQRRKWLASHSNQCTWLPQLFLLVNLITSACPFVTYNFQNNPKKFAQSHCTDTHVHTQKNGLSGSWSWICIANAEYICGHYMWCDNWVSHFWCSINWFQNYILFNCVLHWWWVFYWKTMNLESWLIGPYENQ